MSILFSKYFIFIKFLHYFFKVKKFQMPTMEKIITDSKEIIQPPFDDINLSKKDQICIKENIDFTNSYLNYIKSLDDMHSIILAMKEKNEQDKVVQKEEFKKLESLIDINPKSICIKRINELFGLFHILSTKLFCIKKN